MKVCEPIYLSPVFQERIWGGQKLSAFGYDLPYEKTGECWGISAHQNGMSIVRSGQFKGKSLEELWQAEPELFGGETTTEFPLLVKLLDAKEDLSVQVHPNDDQASLLEDGEAYGKTECWYVVSAEADSELILGHTAATSEEFEERITTEEWSQLLKRVPIKTGDFFHVPSGTIHAIGAGSVILETQQSSDTTYRVYDFDRTDDEGKKRELHLDKAKQVTMVPHEPYSVKPEVILDEEGNQLLKLVTTPFFSVFKVTVAGLWENQIDAPYLLVSVLAGDGVLEADEKTFELKKGDHLVIPKEIVSTFKLRGNIEAIISHT